MPKTDWQQTDGRVVKVESISARGRRQLIITFSYEVSGNRYESELYTFKSMNVDEPLVVTYDASNPKTTKFAANYVRTWRIWWIVMAAIVVVVFLLLLWIRTPRLP